MASTTAADALGLGAAQGTQLFEELARQLPVGSFQLPRPLANLTLEKLAKFYFGPDFWCILAGRFLCLFWWTLKQNPGSGAEAEQWSRQARAAIHQQQTQTDGSRAGQARALWRSLNASLPIRRRTLIKVLLVLAYAQMIIQQMDNKHHLQSQINLLGAQPSDGASGAAGCCGASVHSPESGSAGAEDTTNPKTGENLAAWFNCMWTSAKNCAAAHQDPRPASDSPGTTRFARYCSYLAAWFARMMDQLSEWARTLRRLVASVDLVQLVSVWLARWRSVIVQRLAQSALVQLYYIQRVLFIYE